MAINLEDIQAKVKEELKITDLTVDNQNNIPLQHYYFQQYVNCKSQLYKIEFILDKVYQELYHHYKFEYNKELRTNEIELWIKADEKFKKVKKIYVEKELEVEYLLEVVKMFQNRGFAIKNAIQLEMLKK